MHYYILALLYTYIYNMKTYVPHPEKDGVSVSINFV